MSIFITNNTALVTHPIVLTKWRNDSEVQAQESFKIRALQTDINGSAC